MYICHLYIIIVIPFCQILLIPIVIFAGVAAYTNHQIIKSKIHNNDVTDSSSSDYDTDRIEHEFDNRLYNTNLHNNLNSNSIPVNEIISNSNQLTDHQLRVQLHSSISHSNIKMSKLNEESIELQTKITQQRIFMIDNMSQFIAKSIWKSIKDINVKFKLKLKRSDRLIIIIEILN